MAGWIAEWTALCQNKCIMLRCDPMKNSGGRLDNDGLESALEKVPRALMAAIEPDGVTDAQPLHAGGEVRLEGFQHEMEMIFHEHVSVQPPAKLRHGIGEQFAEMLVIAPVTKNRLLLVAASGEVIPATGAFEA